MKLNKLFAQLGDSFAVWKVLKREHFTDFPIEGRVIDGDYHKCVVLPLANDSKLKVGDTITVDKLDILTIGKKDGSEKIYKLIEQ